MKFTLVLTLILLSTGCDLGSKSDEKRVRNPLTSGNDELTPAPTPKKVIESVLYVESEDSQKIKNKMVLDIESVSPQAPVPGEQISYYKTYFQSMEKKFVIPGDEAITCVFNSNEDIVEEEILEVFDNGVEISRRTIIYPNTEKAEFVSPQEHKTSCENNIALLKDQNFNALPIERIVVADELEKNRRQALDKLDYIEEVCRNGGDFSKGRCVRHEMETSFETYELDGKEYDVYESNHKFVGTDGEINHKWGICYQAPYFSNGYNCLISDNEPEFEKGTLHPILCLGVIKYSRPGED